MTPGSPRMMVLPKMDVAAHTRVRLPAHYNYSNKCGKAPSCTGHPAGSRRWKGSGSAAVRLPARVRSRAKRLVHNPADGSRAAPALRAATETTVHFPGGSWSRFLVRQRRPHIVVSQHVAGTHDHCCTIRTTLSGGIGITCNFSLKVGKNPLQGQNTFFVDILTLILINAVRDRKASILMYDCGRLSSLSTGIWR